SKFPIDIAMRSASANNCTEEMSFNPSDNIP
ncbi:unnamed protein product, partial [Didymodactylos carnosus]